MNPKPVSNLDMAFPADITDLMPSYNSIPDEFKRHTNKYNRVVSQWFFTGLKVKLTPKPGIDYNMAMRHMKTILGSFEPKHEHKEAAVAYLMSQWFDLPD